MNGKKSRSEAQAAHTRAMSLARRIVPDDYTVTMSVRIPHAMMERLREASAAEGYTIASWVRKTLGEAANNSSDIHYKTQREHEKRCPYCGGVPEPGAIFCTVCGHRLP